MQVRTFRVHISITEGWYRDIKATYANVDNGVLHLTIVTDKPDNAPGKDYASVGAFVDWQFYEVLDES